MDNLSAPNAEDVMKRRLLIDGDGVGDDRKIATLVRTYVQYTTRKELSPEESATMHRRLLVNIHQTRMSILRTKDAINVNEESKDMFHDLRHEVQAEIVKTKNQIVESKELLEEATKHRKYSMEYDALAKLIESKPDRKGNDAKRVELEKDLQNFKTRQTSLEFKLEERKKIIAMMSSTIERLNEILEAKDHEPPESMSENAEEQMQVTRMEVDEPTPEPVENRLLPPEDAMDQHILSQNSDIAVSAPTTTVPATQNSASASAAPSISSTTPGSTGKGKSEKYEDLSESEGEHDS